MAERTRDDGGDAGRGPIAWMVHNRVTPNLLMLVLLAGGVLIVSFVIRKEVFPEFVEDEVTVSMAYPGASPEEVEQGIVLAIEEAVRGIDGVSGITATAGEGAGQVDIELEEGSDRQRIYQEIQQEIDRVRTFPEEAEAPQVRLVSRQRDVLSVQIYGDADEWALRDVAERVRDRLLQTGAVTQVELTGARGYEVDIEVSQENLRAYGLTLEQIARKINATSVELPGGGVKTDAGEILLRFDERKDWAGQFAGIPIVTSADGTVLFLRDIATVTDTFEDVDREATLDGKRAIGLGVSRVGKETPIGVSEAVRAAMANIEADLPAGIDYTINRDMSEIYRQRRDLLAKNAGLGLILVFLVLGVFLEFKLAFWVMMGIPTSFLGAMLFLPGTDVTINMISMFAFIVAMGIVVDDAIVAGENIYEYQQQGMGFAAAAIRGARDVSLPIGFSILTNIVAFAPLLFVPGTLGRIFGVMPVVVSLVFIISWVEALFILPAHLAHTRSQPGNRVTAALHRAQQGAGNLLSGAVVRLYRPFISTAVNFRYLTVALAIAGFVLVVGYAVSGRMGFVLMPKVESDRAHASATLPYGSPIERAREVRDELVSSAAAVIEAHGGDALSEGVFAVINGNRVEVTIYLTGPTERPISTAAMTELWREAVGPMLGLQSLRFESDRGGPGRGPSVTCELSHRDIPVLDRASAALAARLAEFPVVKDIDDGYTPGKPQIDLELNESGRSLGLTSFDVARQVRHAFYGAEALRQQRGRNEVKVMVRLPRAQRVSEYDIEQLLIRAPSGRDVPLMEIAAARRGRAYTSISRRDGRRTVTITANVTPQSEVNRVLASVTEEMLPELMNEHAGLSYSFEGRQAEMRDALVVMKYGFIVALVVIYILLAIPFRSYIQPVIVMFAIPFGVVGATVGHKIMGYNLSVISMFGIIALAGVVVNDALVMVDFANRRRRAGAGAFEAITGAGVRRFRPILLTTLTTFGGLAPMIFETSRQARFMIPMAISLGYGIVFATAITLVIVPCLYVIVEDGLDVIRFAYARPGQRHAGGGRH